MNLRRIKYALLRLSPEEKVISVACVVVLASAFMPWFSISLINGKSSSLTAFDGSMGIIGFVVFLFTALTLGFVLANHLKIKLPSFGYKKEQISLFFLGESAFLLLLTIAMYTKESFEYSNAEIRFGLYGALAGAILGTFAAFAQIQKRQKKNVESFFNHEEAEVESVQEINLEAEYPPIKSPEPIAEETVQKPVEQGKFFYAEEAGKTQESADEQIKAKEEIVAVSRPEQAGEDEMAENVEVDEAQKDFFAREAGIKVDMDSVKPVKKSEPVSEVKKKPVNESGDFYDDL